MECFVTFKLKPLQATSDAMLHLDALRFIASVGIVITHSEEYFFSVAQRRAQTNIGLALFVDMFFLISGFVMAYVYAGKVANQTQILTFFWRRFARLVPLHVLTLVLSVAIWAAVAKVTHGLPKANTAPSGDIACLADTLFLLHGVIPCGNGLYHNGVTWSISVEMLLYGLFPVICWLGRKWIWFPLLMGVAVLLGDMAYVVAHGGLYAKWELYSPLRGLPSFMLGMAMFTWRGSLEKLRVPHWTMAALIVALAVAMVSDVPNIFRLLMVYAVVMLAVAADTAGRIPAYIRRIAPLGQLTYSIYLWHGLLILVLMNGIADKYLHLSGAPMIAMGLLTYALLAVVSYLSYELIEDPARRYLDGIGRKVLQPTRSSIGG
jgi:peptidoglycan/LPS O-acetylase OafA/YrhL